tara:strand:+ start:4492 stop:6270 length:1779 start_codon:yes stop_codon:yes gene_type:complete
MEAEVVKKKDTKEFETLLEESFKKNSLKEGTIIKAKVSEVGKKFVLCEIPGSKFEGIVPIQEFQFGKELENLKPGSSIDLYLDRLESWKSEIVVSREKSRRMSAWRKMEKAYKNQEEVSGKIVNRTRGGYVVSIDSCLAFLPGSQIDTKIQKNVDHLMNVPLKFLCVKMDDVRKNIVVSRRAILEKNKNESLDKVLSKIKEGDIVEGTARALTDWGCFVDINVDGTSITTLLHITDMSYNRVKRPHDLISINDTIKVKIIKIDHQNKKVSVGIKQMQTDPFDNVSKKYKPGDIVFGIVSKIVDYGCFVRLMSKDGKEEEGLEGLLHSSEIHFQKRNVHPSKLLSVSEKIKVKIIELDVEKRRISLSKKQCEENPWIDFSKKYPVGSIVNTAVKSISDFALFVSIEGTEFVGMIHFRDIAYGKETEENLKKFSKRQNVKAKILELDLEKEKIRCGIRQLEKDPFSYFDKKSDGEIITATVKEVLKSGIKVSPGNEENLLITIKKPNLAKNIEDCRPEIFTPGNKIDAMIIDLDKKSRRANLSIKALEEHNEKIAIEKYGKDGTSSGKVLGDLFGKVFKSKKTKKDKKEKKSKK